MVTTTTATAAAAQGATFDVDVRYYANDGTWVAVSDDIRGLAVEASSLPELHEALDDIATTLLLHNTGMDVHEVAAATLRVALTIVLRERTEEAGTTLGEAVPQPRRLYSPTLAFA